MVPTSVIFLYTRRLSLRSRDKNFSDTIFSLCGQGSLSELWLTQLILSWCVNSSFKPWWWPSWWPWYDSLKSSRFHRIVTRKLAWSSLTLQRLEFWMKNRKVVRDVHLALDPRQELCLRETFSVHSFTLIMDFLTSQLFLLLSLAGPLHLNIFRRAEDW